jgi:hypothetical protein
LKAVVRIDKLKRKNRGKKREKSQKLGIFGGNFEKWGGW